MIFEAKFILSCYFIDYPIFLLAAYFRVLVFQTSCAHMTLYKYFNSELPCKPQANKCLTVCDIESANGKVKAELDNLMLPEKKRKVCYRGSYVKLHSRRKSKRRMVFL